ncbi:MAG TPA: hypothetical protein DD668_06275 [Alphaproteobacteria bacterium]|jgi:hypothetical protein|nr:hypothetical protein [Rhodospirillaceae bacterium]HBP59169.1 hypothetical protein [Alphaproteobacteria bacterium]HCD20213.1 hypothetical protein [Alphaproteobacteria bacterium]|tara:strand:+ start:404 stop:1084 length:681 start_codon:yes stop_codon:yes gene_type:complete
MTNSIDQLIETLSQLSTALLAEVMTFMPPVDPALHLPILAGSGAIVLLLLAFLVARIRKAQINARATEAFGREVTFEDISSEAASVNEAASAHGAQAPVMPDKTAQVAGHNPAQVIEEASAPADNAEAQPTGFTFFKRNSKSSVAHVGTTQPASQDADTGIAAVGEAATAATHDSQMVALDDDAFLIGLEQEMLATRQLYLDGMISKEVYVSETRALYSKAQSRMT